LGKKRKKKVTHQIQVILQKKVCLNLIKFKIKNPNLIKALINKKNNKIKARMLFGEIKNNSKIKHTKTKKFLQKIMIDLGRSILMIIRKITIKTKINTKNNL
jgi:hypothetical protein